MKLKYLMCVVMIAASSGAYAYQLQQMSSDKVSGVCKGADFWGSKKRSGEWTITGPAGKFTSRILSEAIRKSCNE
ncbi:hypothetical protein OAH87_02610 [Marinomonas sp.]|nr:hypothetical protein [Marinomonas sp.]MDB4837338.1 hypothetical protein [Marinomonas sp.]